MKETLKIFRDKLNNNEFVYGPFMKTSDPMFVEAVGLAGFDYVILDMEHGPVTIENQQNNIRAAEARNTVPIIRLKDRGENTIGKALDIGAYGIQVPQINNAEEAKNVVKFAKFYPYGMRGVCRFVRAADYSNCDRYKFFESSKDVLIILQLEGIKAIENLDEILDVEGVDILFIGPYDLSQSLGIPGQVNNPVVVNAMKDIVERAKAKGKVALLIALVFVVGFAFLQPYLPGQADPNLCQVDSTTGIQFRNIAPGEEGFIWGSNAIGQDLWARIWAGARTSLTIAFFVALIEAVVGITVGVLWGYVRQLDFFFTELYNICDNIPSTIILILISYVASPSIQTLILGMSITGWIAMARFIRNQILIIRDRDYNVASRCIGTPIRRIVLRNLLPYLVSVIMLRMALTIPAAIGSEVFITYIGLGLSVETPSLGNLINDGRKVMMQAGLRYQLLYPTIILSFVTIAFYLIGNAFSDAADPKNHLQ